LGNFIEESNLRVNGNYFENAAGNWQKITKENRVYPAWSYRGGNKKDPVMKIKALKVECRYCGKVKLAIAYHPTNKKIKFCSLEHGKLYMFKYPDTRYADKT